MDSKELERLKHLKSATSGGVILGRDRPKEKRFVCRYGHAYEAAEGFRIPLYQTPQGVVSTGIVCMECYGLWFGLVFQAVDSATVCWAPNPEELRLRCEITERNHEGPHKGHPITIDSMVHEEVEWELGRCGVIDRQRELICDNWAGHAGNVHSAGDVEWTVEAPAL